MSTPALDDRTFESAVELTPEQEAANTAHFEAKGYQIGVVDEEGNEVAQPTDETETKDPAVAGEKPADSAASEVDADATVDAETRADFESAKNDGEKLGKYARRTKKLHELESTVATTQAEIAKRDADIAELRKQLAEKSAQPSSSSFTAPAATKPVATEVQPAAKKPEPVKPKEFDKPRPARPKFEDFAEVDGDQYAAHAAAVAEHADKVADWYEEKRVFDGGQRELVAKQNREQDERFSQERSQQERIDQKFQEARSAHPDFDSRTQVGDLYAKRLAALLVTEIPDGLELGYQLALPEHEQVRKALNETFYKAKTESEIQSAIYDVVADLALFRRELKAKAAASATTETTPAKAATTETAPPPKQTPSTKTPQREEAAPVPVRGRNASTMRPEDVDPMDSDRRRELRRVAV